MENGRRWAPNAKHAALACAPIAAVLVAVGAGGGGLLLGRVDVAAAGAGAGVLAVGLQQARSRSLRRRQRQERAALRARLHALEADIAQLRRELAAAPSILRPDSWSAPTTGPLPVVDAFDRAAAPATPRSLPILTANRRGLQSCAPGLPGMSVPAVSVPAAFPGLLPGQRPPATPITGLHLPPVVDPSLPALEPGPSDPVPAAGGLPEGMTGGLPLLTPGPSVPVEAAPQRRAPTGTESSGTEASATIVDLRTIADPAPASAGRPGAAALDELVFSAIAQAEADAFTLVLERPGRAAASLFEPVRSASSHQGVSQDVDRIVDRGVHHGIHDGVEQRIDRAADDARTAARAMRPGIPPSPYFTPGAFVGDGVGRSGRGESGRDGSGRDESGRHCA